jgi:hypothetical protein
MKVHELQAILATADPEAEVVVLDRTEDRRFGMVRPLCADDVEALTLGRVQDGGLGSWLCPWSERPVDGDTLGPLPGLLLGPR